MRGRMAVCERRRYLQMSVKEPRDVLIKSSQIEWKEAKVNLLSGGCR